MGDCPQFAVGRRQDISDDNRSTGLELRAAFTIWSTPQVTTTGDLHGLVRDDDYKEWGIAGTLHVAPGAAGRGLAARIEPSWEYRKIISRRWGRTIVSTSREEIQ